MNTRKICLWAVPAVVVIAGAVYFFFFKDHHQVIKFSDDSKVTLLAVEYGKRHAPPTVKMTGNARPRRGGSFTTTNDTLVLWLQQEYDAKEWHNFEYYVQDKSATACVQNYGRDTGGGRGNSIVSVQVDAFPRRQSKFNVRVQERGNNFTEMAEKKFVISNPTRGSFTKWTPESLPTMKDDQDLTVTVTKAVAGVQMPYNRGDSEPDDVMNRGVQLSLHVERNAKSVHNWEPVSIVTSDATGNSVGGWVGRNDWREDEDLVTYQWGLWPDEPAWKIRMELSQQSDFADYELWKVDSLPVLPGKQQEMYNNNGRRNTNSPCAETDLNGFHLKIFPAKEFTDVGQNNWMQGGLFIEATPAANAGYRMQVKVTDSQNAEIPSSEYGNWSNNNVLTYRYRLQDISGLTNLNVSVVLHQSHYLEFTVKPVMAVKGQ